MTDWHTLTAAEVLRQLASDQTRGLDDDEAARRLGNYGPNELAEGIQKSPWRILWDQLTATLVVVLIAAALVSAALGDFKDTVAIVIIVVLNALLGFSQEYQAEKAMAALRTLAVPRVKVRRGGRVSDVSARELAPGDIVLLEAGNRVPADCRLLESASLRTEEAMLTGESEPVEKHARVLEGADLPLGDRRNLAYMGTVVTYGRGRGVVTETGMNTQLGRIAAMLQQVDHKETPLQSRLNQLGRGLAAVALALVGVIFLLGLMRGEGVRLMFLTAVSMAVAAVPEGLPAVVTIALALGAQRMLKRKALIRKLPAVETLGSVTVICADKTGTLTENRMTVAVVDVVGHQVDVSQYLADGGAVPDSPQCPPAVLRGHPALAMLLAGSALCNDALLESTGEESGRIHAVGDATEAALVVAAARFGLRKTELEKTFPRVAEIPFDSARKRMTTIHAVPSSPSQIPAVLGAAWRAGQDMVMAPYVVFTKGAVDSLLEVSSRVSVEGRIEPLTREWHARVSSTQNRLARSGMRVIGVAYRLLGSRPNTGSADSVAENDLILVGMISIIDPPRLEVKEAVQTCKGAGIRTVMITGDHVLTAQYVARELGIASDGRLLTGPELTRLSDRQLEEIVEDVPVYARVSPEHKLSIVKALQNRGHIVAMTGDGVNDAPALKKADIGVAMGITGTDVAKEAADMVLLDDNFATIVGAVEEGRVIYDNIRKFIKYLMTTNSGELWLMLLAPLLGMPLPLLPLQLLWINLVTDGLPALALSVEPAERYTMRRAPYHPSQSVFGGGMGRHVLWVGFLMGLLSLSIGYWYWQAAHAQWRTMVFTVLALSQMGHVLAIRSNRDSLFSIGLLSNRPLLTAVVLTFVFQLLVVYLPFCQHFFQTGALSGGDLAISLGLSSFVFWEVELEKWWIRRRTGEK